VVNNARDNRNARTADDEIPLISIGYDMHELAEEFCSGGVGQGREGDGAAPCCGEVAVGIGVGGEEENDSCPENYRQPGFDDFFHLWILL